MISIIKINITVEIDLFKLPYIYIFQLNANQNRTI